FKIYPTGASTIVLDVRYKYDTVSFKKCRRLKHLYRKVEQHSLNQLKIKKELKARDVLKVVLGYE
ncbi:hypothetical protein KC887_07915, partial [Candidatus Kaiserbacteria bacterium]|nr:hypothetical protein [Candidatus Kaiserbacteria bacterium]